MNKGQFKKGDKRTIKMARRGGRATSLIKLNPGVPLDRFLIIDPDIDQPIILQRKVTISERIKSAFKF